MTTYALVGDVGGTNARLALCEVESGSISQTKTFATSDYDSLEAVIRHYLDEQKQDIKDGCIAIACPITDDWVEMTNHDWAFSTKKLKENIGFEHLEIINDFTAVSMAIPMLGAEHVIQFGGKEPVKDKPVAIYGAELDWASVIWCMLISAGSACLVRAVTLTLRPTAKKKIKSLKCCGKNWAMCQPSACCQARVWSISIGRL